MVNLSVLPVRKDRQKEKRMLKERDDAWTRVEALAMRHPNYKVIVKGNTNNPYTLSQHLDSSPPYDDGDADQTPLTLEKIEVKANEVSFSFFCFQNKKKPSNRFVIIDLS